MAEPVGGYVPGTSERGLVREYIVMYSICLEVVSLFKYTVYGAEPVAWFCTPSRIGSSGPRTQYPRDMCV